MANADLTRINTNIAALNALNALREVNSKLSLHQLRLATGRRINSAADDPAGMTFAKKLDSRARGLAVARDNIGDVQNLLAVAEGGIQQISEILITMKEKILQAATDTLGSSERAAVESQLDDLAAEIDQIVEQTTWGGVTLLDGTYAGKQFQVGEQATDTLSCSISQDHRAAALSVADSDLDVSTSSAASTSLSYVNAAINTINTSLQAIGSTSARMSIKEANVSVAITNVMASYSRIYNADMALEQLEATKYLVLQQTATAMLAQANLTPQSILSLIRGG
ncbi:MAG TPA: flagellin, partial [Firmicutes bacterium]|nr:flagellin [Bacillota bacterium]